jgi:hypothetical protein
MHADQSLRGLDVADTNLRQRRRPRGAQDVYVARCRVVRRPQLKTARKSLPHCGGGKPGLPGRRGSGGAGRRPWRQLGGATRCPVAPQLPGPPVADNPRASHIALSDDESRPCTRHRNAHRVRGWGPITEREAGHERPPVGRSSADEARQTTGFHTHFQYVSCQARPGSVRRYIFGLLDASPRRRLTTK